MKKLHLAILILLAFLPIFSVSADEYQDCMSSASNISSETRGFYLVSYADGYCSHAREYQRLEQLLEAEELYLPTDFELVQEFLHTDDFIGVQQVRTQESEPSQDSVERTLRGYNSTYRDDLLLEPGHYMTSVFLGDYRLMYAIEIQAMGDQYRIVYPVTYTEFSIQSGQECNFIDNDFSASTLGYTITHYDRPSDMQRCAHAVNSVQFWMYLSQMQIGYDFETIVMTNTESPAGVEEWSRVVHVSLKKTNDPIGYYDLQDTLRDVFQYVTAIADETDDAIEVVVSIGNDFTVAYTLRATTTSGYTTVAGPHSATGHCTTLITHVVRTPTIVPIGSEVSDNDCVKRSVQMYVGGDYHFEVLTWDEEFEFYGPDDAQLNSENTNTYGEYIGYWYTMFDDPTSWEGFMIIVDPVQGVDDAMNAFIEQYRN